MESMADVLEEISWILLMMFLKMEKFHIKNIVISVTTPLDTELKIKDAVKKGKKGYVCVSNVNAAVFASKHADYREIYNNAYICTPDGMPLVWMARLWGLVEKVQRTPGPDLFVKMLSDRDNGIKHFLLGDTVETQNAILQKFNNSRIVGNYSPPFCNVEEFDYKYIASLINDSGADVVWVSLHSPKQDFFSARLLPFLNKAICVNVGAAFRFSLGQYKHPNKYLRRLGLTGLFWRKWSWSLFKWYFSSFIVVLEWSVSIIIRRLQGYKYFE